MLAPDREAYAELSGLITRGRMRATKGSYRLSVDDVIGGITRCAIGTLGLRNTQTI